MNFYPIYRNKKLLPWIKWWLIKGNKVMPKHLSEWINSASAITITGVYKGSPLLNLNLNGNTSQTGTPTPEAPVPVNVVKEVNYININDDTFKVNLGGTNLFNFNDTGSVTNSTVDSEGWITATIDNSTGTGWAYANYFVNLIPQLKENTTYSILVELKEINGNLRNIVFNASNSQINTSVNIVLANYQEGSKVVNTVTTRESFSGIQYGLRLYVDTRANTSGSVTYRVSLIEGTNISTEYSPYVANPIELCKIGDYQDVIYKQNNKYYVEKHIGMYDSWTSVNRSTVNTNTITYQFVLPMSTDSSKRQYVLCNYFQNAINNNDNEHIFVGTTTVGVFNGLNVFIDKTRATTNEEAIGWLKNNGVKVYYVLSTSTTTEITETNLINQLEAIYNAKLQSGTNTITQTPSDLPFYLNFQYYEKG